MPFSFSWAFLGFIGIRFGIGTMTGLLLILGGGRVSDFIVLCIGNFSGRSRTKRVSIFWLTGSVKVLKHSQCPVSLASPVPKSKD